MKAKINYKSKKTIIIAIIVLALIVISGIAIGLFLKGNRKSEAAEGNNIGNTINNNAGENTPQNNNNNVANENQNNNNNEQNENQGNQNQGNANQGNANQGNANQGNANQGNANQGNVNQGNANQGNATQEFVTQRVEIIPERVIAENYFVSWEPTKFETLINEKISLEKANIVAEKTVAKLTELGLQQNPASVKVGEILQYTINLTNTNPKVNGLVSVTDVIPAGTEFISATKTNLKTTPEEYENPNEVTNLAWKNVKVEAGSKVQLLVNVKVVANIEKEDTTAVQNIATITDGTSEEQISSSETKVANITSNKSSKVIYNNEKPHEHTVAEGIEPLHEQDIIEYTITLTNVGKAAGTVEVVDTVPEGTTFINGGVVTVVDKNGTTTYQMSDLVEGIDVTVDAATEEAAGVATVTFRVIVNSFDEETKVIKNDMAKVDNKSTNTTEDNAEKVYIDLPVTKVWENMGSDAAQVYKLNSIKFQVKNGENLIAEKVVANTANEENGIAGEWKYTFTNLPKYDENGNEINYTVEELATNSNDEPMLATYYNSNTEVVEDLAVTTVTITNTFDPSKVQDETIELTAKKEWENLGSDAAKDYAISSITLQVRVYTQDGSYVLAQIKEVTAEDGWIHTFTGLKKYDINGNKIHYVVDEVVTSNEDKAKLAAYNKNVETLEDGTIVVTNTFDPAKVQEDKTELTAKKSWANMESDAAKDYAISSITLQLKLNDEVLQEKAVTANEDWTHTFTDLKKYDVNGAKLQYTVDETVEKADVAKLAVYNKNIENLEDGTIVVTNTFDPSKVQEDKTEVTAKKLWANMESDAAKDYAISNITLQLKLNGEVLQEKAVTANEDWTYTFTDLKKYDADGNFLAYEVDEVVTNEADVTKLVVYDKNVATSEDGAIVVTNAFNPSKVQEDKTQITAKKSWANMESDAAKDYAISSITLQVRVYAQDGSYVLAQIKEVTAEDGWIHTFTGLKKYDINGNKIHYVVDEVATSNEDKAKLAAYDKNITTSEDGTIVITNTFNTSKVQEDKTEITAEKLWNDDNNKAGVRPTSIEFVLVQDGVETKTKLTATADTNWKVIFEGLHKYTAEGRKIVYTVKEIAVNYYNTTYSTDGLTATNTIDYTSIMTSKTITKVWEDNSNRYNTRPENVKITLNSVEYTLSQANDEDKSTLNEWTLTINNLQKYDAQGNEIEYSVAELAVPEGYTKTESGLTVTNTANVIVEKSAYKAKQDGTIGNEATKTDVFKAGETVYYKLTFKNAGNTIISTKTLTDTLPLRLELLAIDNDKIAENTTSGTDTNGYTWTLSKNKEGNIVIDWTLINVPAGEQKELLIKAKVVAEAEYKDLCQKLGEQTKFAAQLFVRKDGKVPYEGSGTEYRPELYTNSLGTVYLTSADIFYNTEINLKNDDLYYLINNNNKITEMVSKGITRAELEKAITENGMTLDNNQVVVWYVIKSEFEGYHIDGVIRNISELTSINNEVYMDNVKQDDVAINLEDVEIGQSGTVTVIVKSSTTEETVPTPMDVVFVIDTSGSMKGSNAQNMVNAVNSSIKTIMSKNSDTRIGVVGFSDDSSTIIPLGKYAQNRDYLKLTKITAGIFEDETYTISSNVTKNASREVVGGTNTQAGIKSGAEMLTKAGLERSFTITTDDGITLTGTRTPVLILVTDGEPTYYYENNTATGTHKGNGRDTDENYYYWTIRTAKCYKDEVTQKYYGENSNKQAKMFTIGIGMSGKLATAMLKPDKTNVDELTNRTGMYSEERKLYNLLNNEGTPYAYDYADGTKAGSLTESDIQSFITSSLEGSMESTKVRAITIQESKARRINLIDMDTTKPFSLEIIGEETTKTYSSLQEALNDPEASYVKLDNETNTYYIDLTNITRQTTVNVNYSQK